MSQPAVMQLDLFDRPDDGQPRMVTPRLNVLAARIIGGETRVGGPAGVSFCLSKNGESPALCGPSAEPLHEPSQIRRHGL
jgi:hypothetical protein